MDYLLKEYEAADKKVQELEKNGLTNTKQYKVAFDKAYRLYSMLVEQRLS